MLDIIVHHDRLMTINQRCAGLWASRAESAQEIHDKAYGQNQANPAAADDGSAKVKSATTEQEKENHQE